jgi:hypothetical protein
MADAATLASAMSFAIFIMCGADFRAAPQATWLSCTKYSVVKERPAVVAIAKSLGLRTTNIVRREDAVAGIKGVGGDVVLVDGPDLAKRVAAETGTRRFRLRSTE